MCAGPAKWEERDMVAWFVCGRRYAAVTHWWDWYRGNECDGTSRQNGVVLGVFWQKGSEGRTLNVISCNADFVEKIYDFLLTTTLGRLKELGNY
jgi:hypothetical protein